IRKGWALRSQPRKDLLRVHEPSKYASAKKMRSCHRSCRKPLFRLASQGLSQISGWRVLRVIGHFVLSLSRRCFGASVGEKFCRNTSDQRWSLHRPFHPLLALFLFWLRQEAKGLKRTPCPLWGNICTTEILGLFQPGLAQASRNFGICVGG